MIDEVSGNQFLVVVRRPKGVTPEVTPPVTPPVSALLALLVDLGQLSNAEIRDRMKLKDRTHVREHYIEPAFAQGFIEYTIPDKPNSRLQKYRLTAAGQAWLGKQN
ncbi:MAG: hypothetical protein Q7V56_00870 [Gammaproteobacteria bacterium]|nr:hypothetical protein [Gammaproteobacteria bacterium]